MSLLGAYGNIHRKYLITQARTEGAKATRNGTENLILMFKQKKRKNA